MHLFRQLAAPAPAEKLVLQYLSAFRDAQGGSFTGKHKQLLIDTDFLQSACVAGVDLDSEQRLQKTYLSFSAGLPRPITVFSALPVPEQSELRAYGPLIDRVSSVVSFLALNHMHDALSVYVLLETDGEIATAETIVASVARFGECAALVLAEAQRRGQSVCADALVPFIAGAQAEFARLRSGGPVTGSFTFRRATAGWYPERLCVYSTDPSLDKADPDADRCLLELRAHLDEADQGGSFVTGRSLALGSGGVDSKAECLWGVVDMSGVSNVQ
jgi:hypothetical protein